MAPNGRINIPTEYLEYGNLKKNVLMIGMGFSIRVWDVDEYDKVKMDKTTFAQKFKEKRKNKTESK
jgi:MraZ protein